MYIDESGANERSLDRKYGWSEKGVPARVISSAKRTKKWSILPVYTYHGFVAWEVIHGSYNSELFVDFLRLKVLPLTTPYPGRNSVLIMDNARIHHHAEVSALCREAGIILAYLPPYSPDLNPIEEAFAELKAWFKKNYKLAEIVPFKDFLALGLNTVKDGAKNHFARSQVGVPIAADDADEGDYYER